MPLLALDKLDTVRDVKLAWKKPTQSLHGKKAASAIRHVVRQNSSSAKKTA
jgi:hypothetical protein